MVISRGNRSPTKDVGLKGMDWDVIKSTETRSSSSAKRISGIYQDSVEQDGAGEKRRGSRKEVGRPEAKCLTDGQEVYLMPD